MIDLATDIHSLTDFKRRTADYIEQIKQTGHPLVLTLNGKAELVVHDAASYQRLLDALDRVEATEGIRRGLKSVQEGRTRPVEEVFEEIRQAHEVPG
jgi:prevent-host-death family protein